MKAHSQKDHSWSDLWRCVDSQRSICDVSNITWLALVSWYRSVMFANEMLQWKYSAEKNQLPNLTFVFNVIPMIDKLLSVLEIHSMNLFQKLRLLFDILFPISCHWTAERPHGWLCLPHFRRLLQKLHSIQTGNRFCLCSCWVFLLWIHSLLNGLLTHLFSSRILLKSIFTYLYTGNICWKFFKTK